MIGSAEIYKLAERHLGSDSHVFSDERFDAEMNVVRGECKDKALAFISAVIAANNAKVLADLKPWKISGFGDAYTPDQVAALIQERDALAARVKELEAQSKQSIKDALEEAAQGCISLQDCGPDNGCCPTYWNEALEKAEIEIRKLKDQL